MSKSQRMHPETYRQLVVLAELDSGRISSQRSLARRLGVSLGLANGILRALESEKLVAMDRDAAAGTRYAVTRKGRREMLRCSARLGAESEDLLAPLREEIRRKIERLAEKGHRKALVCGRGALADMVASALFRAGLKPVAVVPEEVKGAGPASCDVAVATTRSAARLLRKRMAGRAPVVEVPGAAGSKEARRGR